MALRGRLVRENAAYFIRSEAINLAAILEVRPADLLIEGKDGIGRKSRVPWVRFASAKRSPSATRGWYVVVLFREDGSGAYLTLAHASTENNDGSFQNRSLQDTQRLMGWARAIISPQLQSDPRLTKRISLGLGKLAQAYELTSAAAYFYPVDAIPPEDQIREDMRSMAHMLSSIYSNEDLQARTGETSLDVIAVLSATEDSTEGRNRSTAQGFGLTQPERRAVELRAMRLAEEHLRQLGYAVEDTSAKHPYDFKATRSDETLYIEVKGTTGHVGDIVLTKNEVNLHWEKHPNNGLIVVHSIQLSRGDAGPHASDGVVAAKIPWKVENEHLEPISYRYRTDSIF
ncbi:MULTISPECIES: MrcB family domain-containing protein [Stenotrophomonas]|uniref:MrcB family domain-containing protein n=1 Tax=Stenotrophomonas TaxID=40323 RepID=UPI0009E6C1D3|nr:MULTISPECIES: DUF3578 domain-containing protein [Stenotrophomonas]